MEIFSQEDLEPPYAVTFQPPLLADDNLTILNSWSISAHAIPINNGRSFMVHKFGEAYTEVVLPEAKLTFTNPELVSNGVIHDGDRVSLQVTVTGESESLKILWIWMGMVRITKECILLSTAFVLTQSRGSRNSAKRRIYSSGFSYHAQRRLYAVCRTLTDR